MKNKELLIRLKNSDEAAFKELFNIFYPRVKAFLLSTHLDKELEDVLQETFITIWIKRESIDVNKSFSSYLFTIAKNHALKALRKQLNKQILEAGTEPSLKDNSVAPDKLVDLVIINDKVKSSIEKLPPQPKAVFKMKHLDGMSTKQVAEKMGLSPKTVDNYMYKALTTLKKELEYSAWFVIFLSCTFSQFT